MIKGSLTKTLLASTLCLCLAACAGTELDRSAASTSLLRPAQHAEWEVTPFGGQGEVRFQANAVELDFGYSLTGINWRGDFPRNMYELELTATRVLGDDFFCCLTFPVDQSYVSLVLGGWGGTTSGLSCIDGKDASENETTRYLGIETGVAYPIRLRVEADQIRIWFDEKLIWDVDHHGRQLSLRPEVEQSRPLGIASFATSARITDLRWRPLCP